LIKKIERFISIEENEEMIAAADEDDGKELPQANEDEILRPSFPPLSAVELAGGKSELRKIPVPAHRYTPLKKHWVDIYNPIVTHMKLQIRMNTKTRNVELKVKNKKDCESFVK
jgi:RNA-binding protein PNO1